MPGFFLTLNKIYLLTGLKYFICSEPKHCNFLWSSQSNVNFITDQMTQKCLSSTFRNMASVQSSFLTPSPSPPFHWTLHSVLPPPPKSGDVQCRRSGLRHSRSSIAVPYFVQSHLLPFLLIGTLLVFPCILRCASSSLLLAPVLS